MGNSIINFDKKKIIVNDLVLLMGIGIIKKTSENTKIPNWFEKYINDVFDVVIDIKPIGWGYMDLDENINSKDKKEFFINILNNSIIYLQGKNSENIESKEINTLLKLEGNEKWSEGQNINKKFIIDFFKELILLLK